MKYILVVHNNQEACNVIRDCLGSEYKVEVVSDWASCLEACRKRRHEFIFIDIFLLRGLLPENGYNDYKKNLQPLWQIAPTMEIIVLSPPAMTRDAVNAVKAGASNYLTYPINPDEVRYVTESIYESIKMQSELNYLRDRFWQSDSLEVIRTNSPAMKTVFDKVKLVAPTRTTVFLSGETGTGKGVIAKLIHRHSNRCDNQFIGVHCGAIPDTLLESELFGHEKGAFTGAVQRKLGKFEIAHGGTIFLDEIGTITASAQIKLLQVLQDRTFNRVGGEEDLEADVRIIAASNIDLKKMCTDGAFRSDLYYRLNVFPIEIPPLRERIEDIPLLVEIFLKRLNKLHQKKIHGLHPQVIRAFEKYPWPGNIRELENLIERAFILETSSILTPESFPSELFTLDAPGARIPLDTSLTLAEVRGRSIENVERQYLKQLLTLHNGRINNTAQAAGISTRQLHKLLCKYCIRKEEFK
ncbi:MAG: sigma-54 dependent transcriptional regulator [bacterium]